MEQKIEQLKTAYAEFIDIAAHDLDAPLRKLTVLVDRVMKDQQDENLQPYIQRINNCIGDMRSIIDGLSNLSRTITDSIQLSPCDISRIIQLITNEMQPVLTARNVILDYNSLPVIEGDERQFCLLFKNLLENSIRFNTSETPKISFSSNDATEEELLKKSLDPSRPYASITVSDNGIGIKPEFAETIFRPFVRLHGKSEYPGKGLGLAICSKIAENHKGVIYAESNENGGARFTLLLPYKQT